MVMEEEAWVYLSNPIISSKAIEQRIMVLKFCTNIFCLNKEVYLKYVFVSDEEQVKFLDCVVQVRVPE